MDTNTYDKLNAVLLQEGSHLGINHFQTLLGQVLGEDAPLVQRLSTWKSEDYAPEQLLSLKSVLPHKVTEATPNLSTMEATGKLIEDKINGERLLMNVMMNLFAVQQLDRFVADYKSIYDRVVNTN